MEIKIFETKPTFTVRIGDDWYEMSEHNANGVNGVNMCIETPLIGIETQEIGTEYDSSLILAIANRIKEEGEKP